MSRPVAEAHDDPAGDMRAKAEQARQALLALAPDGVNPTMWLRVRYGLPLSTRRVRSEIRRALRSLPARARGAVLPHADTYTDALFDDIAGVLAFIQARQEERAARKRRRRPRPLPEAVEWPTYFTWPEPAEGMRPVDELAGPARTAYRKFVQDDSTRTACVDRFTEVHREMSEVEDRRMHPTLALQVDSACRHEAWYDHVRDQGYGRLPPGVWADWHLEDLVGDTTMPDDTAPSGYRWMTKAEVDAAFADYQWEDPQYMPPPEGAAIPF